jgi:hypothetical protein
VKPPLEKPRVDWKKDLQTCGERRKSRKRPTLYLGKDSSGGNVALGRLFCIPPANDPLIGGANVYSVAEFIAI